jgi:uncharacterized protein YggE
MTRAKKLVAICALALAAAAALAVPAAANSNSPDDRSQTISILDRNATILPGA